MSNQRTDADPAVQTVTGPAGRADPDGAQGRRIHGDASRTWELELLVSGAILFALVQMPRALDARLDGTLPSLSSDVFLLVFLTYVYTKAIIYALISCFVVHLCTRAYWVGLIGLDSVFPQGVLWDQTTVGPFARSAYRRTVTDLPASIRRIDDFCSVLFSVGFLLALYFVYTILLMLPLFGLAYLISHFTLGGRHLDVIFYSSAAVVLAPLLILHAVDKRWGPRLRPDGWQARLVARAMRVLTFASGQAMFGSVLLTLSTNLQRWRFNVVAQVLMLVLVLVVAAEFLGRFGALGFSMQDYFATPVGHHTLRTSHYENLRSPGERYAPQPMIQADIIQDPFVRLFIPYRTDRHNAALAAGCANLPVLRPPGINFMPRLTGVAAEDASAVLQCVAQLHRVTINGAPLVSPEFRFFRHPESGLAGFVLYIPTAGLPQGPNELQLLSPPRTGTAPGGGETSASDHYVIPFWL